MNNLCYHNKLLQLFPRLFYLHTLCYFINSCGLIKLSLFYPSFVIFSTFPYLLTTYAIYAPYKCTCTTHQTTQPSLSSYRAHVLCASTTFQLNRRLWPSCHSDMGGSRHGWGFFSLRTSDTFTCGVFLLFVRISIHCRTSLHG